MIPDDVRELFDRLLRIDMAGVIGGHPKKVRVNHKAKSWLDSLPKLPEPPWEDAPEWAQWWAVDACGEAYWHEEEPGYDTGATWESESIVMRDNSTDELQLGIDWRKTLQRRPEAK